jgi:gluconate 2-dehydrogenase gamma chain
MVGEGTFMNTHTLRRRSLLAGTAIALLAAGTASAHTLQGGRPWAPNMADPPAPVRPGPWEYFTPEEGAAVEALVERLIPADEFGPSGKDAGCAVFIDRQLAGFYGAAERWYMRPPFAHGTPEQGIQTPLTPAAQYRVGLVALDVHARAAFAGQGVAQLGATQRDSLLAGLEKGQVKLEGIDGRAFFELLLANTMEGFFADPVYGGNRDMVGWKMLGFPGTRYDFRDHIAKHNEPYPLPPVGIGGRTEWTVKG